MEKGVLDTSRGDNITGASFRFISVLREATAGMVKPAVTQIIDEYGREPFLILISCLLGLRTKDSVSLPISRKLFEGVRTPQKLLNISIDRLENIIRPVGFFRQKAQTLHDVSRELLERFGGQVPENERDLLSIKGIGRKTANLVLGEAFGVPAICVDTHVHRISNRLGLVNSRTPEETEIQLKKILKPEHWIEINRLLVMWGQNVCRPIYPLCCQCVLNIWCQKAKETHCEQ